MRFGLFTFIHVFVVRFTAITRQKMFQIYRNFHTFLLIGKCSNAVEISNYKWTRVNTFRKSKCRKEVNWHSTLTVLLLSSEKLLHETEGLYFNRIQNLFELLSYYDCFDLKTVNFKFRCLSLSDGK